MITCIDTERLTETIDTVRKGLSTDPDAVLSSNGESNSFFAFYTMLTWGAADAAELQTIISSLREVLRSQTEEVSNLKKQLAATKTVNPVREAKLQTQLEQLNREREEEACCSYHDKRFADIPE